MLRSLLPAAIAVFLFVAPVAAQTATPEIVEIGTVERAEVMYQRITLIGMAGFRVMIGRVDGSVANPVDVYMDAASAQTPGLVEASAPDYGDASRMLTGKDGDVFMAVAAIQDGDYVMVFVGGGVTPFLDEFLPLVETLAQRPVTTLEAWLPTLDDMPPGFTASA